MNSKTLSLIILFILLAFTYPILITLSAGNHAPIVKNVYAQQRPGTFFVDITYDVEDADGDLLEITVEASDDDGETYTIIPESLTGDVGENITPGEGKLIVWDVGKDLPGTRGDQFKVRVIADDGVPPGEEMVLIPAGEFSMGDHHDVGGSDEKPVHTVYLDAYYIDVHEVTNAQYATFLNEYGKNEDAKGHELLDIDSSYCLIEKVGDTYQPKAGYEDHPVIEVSWYGAGAYAQFYGKRLPTEAQWEKAARGGLVGKMYPNGDTISHDDANYIGISGRDIWDRTAPVGSFPPYGLYDMAGNVWEWCADEYSSTYYSISPRENPLGPGTPVFFVNDDFTDVTTWRVLRGGSWNDRTYYLRCAERSCSVPTNAYGNVGFRCSQDLRRLPGDVSGNDKVTAYDASLVLQYVVGLIELPGEQKEAADVTGDDTVTALDAAFILQYTVGLITEFPVQSAPILLVKDDNQLLTEIIAELENSSLSTEQKRVLEQLKNLLRQRTLPKQTALLQNYPNPFNPETWIPFQLAQDAPVTIRIYNTKGQIIRRLHLGNQKAGIYVAKDKAAYWEGRDKLGQKVASGVYYYTLQAGNFMTTRKMVILK